MARILLRCIFFMMCIFIFGYARGGVDSLAQSIHFNIENGLPTNKVYSCIQDHNGYIWLATDNGVVRYDGYSFKIFTTSDGLPNNDVWRLIEDVHGRLWVHTHGYTIGYIKDDKYVAVYTSDTRLAIIDFVEINRMCVFNNFDHLIAIDSNNRVYKSKIHTPTETYARLSLDGIHYQFFPDFSIARVNYRKPAVDTIWHCSLPVDSIHAMFGIGIVNDDKVIGFKVGNSNEATIFDINSCGFRKVVFEKDEDIYLVCLRNNIATEHPGYFVFTNKRLYTLNRQFQIVSKIDYKDVIPIKTQVTYVSTDSFNNKWFSTNDAGVWLLPPHATFFERQQITTDIYAAQLVGNTANGYTYWWDKLNRVLKVLDKDLKKLYEQHFQDNVTCVSDCDSQYVHITFRGGMYKYDLQKRVLVDYLYEKPMSYVANGAYQYNRKFQVKDIYLDKIKTYISSNTFNIQHYSQNKLYLNNNVGVVVMNVYPDSTVLKNLLTDRLPNMMYDKANNLFWWNNDKKIAVLNPETDSLSIVPPSILQLLKVNNIQDIKADKSGNVYMLTSTSLVVFNPHNPVLQYYSVNFNLADAHMCLQDSILLIAARAGVAYTQLKDSGNILPFKCILNQADKYYSKVYDFYINQTGKVILNTNNGVYAQDLRALVSTADFYNADGRNFTNVVVHYKGHKSILHANDSFLVPSNNQNIRIELVNFFGKGERSYSYSINNEAVNFNTSGEILFNWEPDIYYKVTCTVKDEVWKSNTYVFYVKRIPQWWQTTTGKRIFWIAGILLLIALGILIALVTRYYVRKANEKRQALTDMELRALYAQINPHFIFNTLGTAQFFINRKKMDEAYNHVNKFSRLLRAYLKASGNRYVTLREEISLLKDYIELQQIRFEQKFDYTIELDNKIAADSMQIPSLLVQPLVENAINHGLFHMQEGENGLLEIRFMQGKSSEELICTIEDNGVGRERSKKIKKDSLMEKEESYGTTLTKKLIDIFREYEKMNIYLEYIDKPAPKTGTIVKLTIGNIKYVA
jgi:two-component sensor histidine kinase